MTDKIRLASDADAEDALDVNLPLEKRITLSKVGHIYEADMFPSDWSPAQVKKGSEELFRDGRFSSGFWSKIPKICSRECDFSSEGSCKLSEKPYGHQCPEERAFLELLMHSYMNELNVSETDMSTLSMVRDLCDIELLLMRKHGILARTDLILEEPILNVRGEPTDFTKLVVNPAISVQEGLLKRKENILKSLVATRSERLKAANDIVRDDELSKTARAIKELRARVERGEIIDGNAKPNFKDDFIDVDPEDVEDPPAPDKE